MSSMSIANYFPYSRVNIVSQSVSKNDAVCAFITAEPDKRFHPVCSECGQPASGIHSWQRRCIRDLPFGPAQVWLYCNYRKVICPRCNRIRVEDLGLFAPCQRVTKRLARTIHELCRVMTVKDVANHFNLNWKSVKNIDKMFLQEAYGHNNYEGLRILAVDEIAVRKGHRYMTVVIDYETGRVVWMGHGRTYDTLSSFFEAMSQEHRNAIEAVAMDMWKPYIKAVTTHVPNAKIVFDLFHVVSLFNKVIDKVRISEYQQASKENKDIYMGTKYLLLKNLENICKPEEREHLKQLLELNETISTVMILKEELKRTWSYKYRACALASLERWCALARTVQHRDVRKFADLLEKHKDGILNHCLYPIHTSRLEGINNKIKVIKRKAYGFRDEIYFSLKVLQAFSPTPYN